jgi:ABC-type oligopeptide transport system substrate-binding subunit
MKRNLWLSVVALAAGVTMLVGAGFAAASTSTANKPNQVGKTGGTMNINLSATDFDFLDPALAYANWSWQFTYLMNCKLLNYPDKNAPLGTKLQPEAADFPVISKRGTVYTFTIKKDAGGCRFNTGEAVTAASFARAINRNLNKEMQSPAVSFIKDIVGAQDVVDGKATSASGVVVSGNKLTITLTKASADFLARITLPFFAAIPSGMPINSKGETTFASAGPYYVKEWVQGRSAEFDRNPNYKGPRPHNIDRFLVTIKTDQAQSFLQVKSGQADWDDGGIPPGEKAGLLAAGLLNKQLFINPVASTTYIALNTSRGVFANVAARKAANYAVDRHAILQQFGVLAGKRDDQFLAPAVAGYKAANIFPTKAPNMNAAKKAYSGGGSATIFVRAQAYQLKQGEIFQYNLKQLGIDATVQQMATAVFYARAGTKGEAFDAAIGGWGWDYPDPYDFLDIFFNGKNIHDTNNNGLSYMNVPAINKALDKAASLNGENRYAAYGNLDIQIVKEYAPHANLYHPSQADYFSARMDPKCFVFQPIYGRPDLGAACFK